MDLFSDLLQSTSFQKTFSSISAQAQTNKISLSSSSSSPPDSFSSGDVTEELVSACVRSDNQLDAIFTRIETSLCNCLEQRLFNPVGQTQEDALKMQIKTPPAMVGHGLAMSLNSHPVSTDPIYRAIREEAQLWRLADRLWTMYEPKQALLEKSNPAGSHASCIGQARASFNGSAMEGEVESSLAEYDGQIALAIEIKSWLEVSAEDDLMDLSAEVTVSDNLLSDIDLRSGFIMWREASANAKVRGIGAKKSLELDPDALFRSGSTENDEIHGSSSSSSSSSSTPMQLSSVDESEENDLLSLCWCFIRAGQINKALILCSQRGQPWLASMLLGAQSWSDDKEDIQNDAMEIEQQYVRKGNPFSRATLASNEAAASLISSLSKSSSADLKRSLLLFAAKRTAQINSSSSLLSTFEDKLWAKTIGILDSAFSGHKLRQRFNQALTVPRHIPLAFSPSDSDDVFVAHVGVSEKDKYNLEDLTTYALSFDLISSLFGSATHHEDARESETDGAMVDVDPRPTASSLPLYARLAEGLCRIALSRAALVDYKHGGRSPPISATKQEIANFIRGPVYQTIPPSFDLAVKANKSPSSPFFEAARSDDAIRDDSRMQLADTDLPLLRFAALSTVLLRDREEAKETGRLVRGLTSIAGIDGDAVADPVDEAADDIIYAFARHLALSPDQHGCRHAEAILALSARMKSPRRAIRLLVSLLSSVPFQGQVLVSQMISEDEVDGTKDDALLPDRFELIRAARIVALELSENGKDALSKNFMFCWREALKQTSLMQALDSFATLQRSSSLARGASVTREVSIARGASLTRDGRSASISSRMTASTHGVNDSFSSASGLESGMTKLAVPMPRFPPVIKRVGVTMVDWMRVTALQWVTEVDLRRNDSLGGNGLVCIGDSSNVLAALAIANALSRLLLPRNPFHGLVATDDADPSFTVKARAFVASIRFIWGDAPYEGCEGCTWMGTEKGGLSYTLVSRSLLERASSLFSASPLPPPQVVEANAWRSFAHAAVHVREWADALNVALPSNETKPTARAVSSIATPSAHLPFSATTISSNSRQPAAEDTFNAFGSALTAAAMSAKNAEIENNWLRKQELSAGSALQAVLQATAAANRAYLSLCTCLESGAGWLHDSVGIDGINCDVKEQVVDYASRDKLIPKADDFRFSVRRRLSLLHVEVPLKTARFVQQALPLLKNHIRAGTYESELRDDAQKVVVDLLAHALSGPVANQSSQMNSFLGINSGSQPFAFEAVIRAKEILESFSAVE